MQNPFLRVKTWVYFVLSHLWWLLGLSVLPFCSGGIATGIHCSIATLEGIYGLVEVSMLFVVPVILPIFFYFYLINQWRVYRGKEKAGVGKMLLILCGSVAVLALGLTLLGSY